MAIGYNTFEVRIDLNAIRHNYRVLCEKGSNVYGVIKADAYGHGMERVAKALESEGADTFAVGTIGEAVQLRHNGCEKRIISLVGPLNEADCLDLAENKIIPFIGSFDQLGLLTSVVRKNNLEVEISLKFETGMSRLGFNTDELPSLIESLKTIPQIHPVMASSHLATSDDPACEDYVESQAAKFKFILETLESAGIKVEASLANSAGILKHDKLHFSAQRGGVALYGANPLSGTKWESFGENLKPAMQVSTKIAAVRELKKGQSISYGCTYTAPKDMKVAIVCAGYADGYSRGLSSKGFMCINGHRAPIIGRVCMQLTAVDISSIPDVRFGGTAYLLGGEGAGYVTAEDLASWWGTITYEIFCLLGLSPKSYIE